MKCVFLTEARVWSCRISPTCRMIEVDSVREQEQKCTSPSYTTCSLAIPHINGAEDHSRCPFLCESLRQYCGAVPFSKLIPYNNDLMCRCNIDAHRYCPTYLERARPNASKTVAVNPDGKGTDSCEARPYDLTEEIPVPERLAYSSNHMWLDIGAEGCCHVGVDAFLARVFDDIESVTFFPKNGVQTVTVVLSVRGMHFPITFPRRMNVTGFNPLLKTDPRAIVDDPYGSGWLFEDLEPRVGLRPPLINQFHGLLHGRDVKAWIHKEVDRMSEFIQQLHVDRSHGDGALLNDGGLFSNGLAGNLDRGELLQLYNHFFSPPSIMGGPALIK